MKIKYFIFNLSLLLVYLNWESVRYNNYLFPSTALSEFGKTYGRFDCHYAKLWCSCRTNYQGGCEVGCSPNTYFTLHNQTSCNKLNDYVLSSFTIHSH